MRRFVLLSAIALLAAGGSGAAAWAARAVRPGPLSGTWSGTIAGRGVKARHIVITVNARQTGGTWKISARCRGALTLDSISNGYHHYRRHGGSGAACPTNDVDCLKRVGANVYDAITPYRSTEYDVSGTLRRLRG